MGASLTARAGADRPQVTTARPQDTHSEVCAQDSWCRPGSLRPPLPSSPDSHEPPSVSVLHVKNVTETQACGRGPCGDPPRAALAPCVYRGTVFPAQTRRGGCNGSPTAGRPGVRGVAAANIAAVQVHLRVTEEQSSFLRYKRSPAPFLGRVVAER